MDAMILPTVDPAFEWRTISGRAALVSPLLDEHAPHFFTTRAWPLGAPGGTDDRDAWREIAAAAGVGADQLIRLRQVHGAEVVEAQPDSEPLQADIIVSDNPSLAIAVQSADCVPLLLADPRTGAVCAAHAGWRGMAAGVPQAAVAALGQRFGSHAQELVAVLGPSIGACCYEVGGDVRSAMVAQTGGSVDAAQWFHPRPVTDPANPSLDSVAPMGREGRWYFDGWACVVAQLIGAGVRPGRIAAVRSCTASHPSAFNSYRRDGAPAGRLAAVIRAAKRR